MGIIDGLFGNLAAESARRPRDGAGQRRYDVENMLAKLNDWRRLA